MTSVYNIMNPNVSFAANHAALMGVSAAGILPELNLSRDSYVEFSPAVFPRDTMSVAKIFSDYASYLKKNDPTDTSAEEIMREIDILSRLYALPVGQVVLVKAGAEVLGCGGWARKGDDWCEGKRMFVTPKVAGTGLGKALAVHVISSARAAGFKYFRLDTLRSLEAAVGLYTSFGFKEIAPYFKPEVSDTIFMELAL